MAKLFESTVVKTFKAPILSTSYCFCWFLFILALLIPFFLGFSTHGFWMKREVYEEQAKVLYRQEILIFGYRSDGSSVFYSSVGNINELFFASLEPMAISSSTRDQNFDGKPDVYDFNITMFGDPSTLRNVKALSFYDYRLRDRVRLDMVTMAYLDVDTPAGASYIFADGTLELEQKQPLKPSSLTRTTYNSTILNTQSSSELFLPLLLSRYFDRNETTYYAHGRPVVMPVGKDSTTSLNFKVRIPPHQEVVYRPGFLETMKFAWVQYISLLIPVGYLLFLFAKFVYGNQILESTVTKNE